MAALRVIKPTGPAPKWTDDMRIVYVPGAKKVGTASYERYQQYSQGKTVAEALKLGSKKSDLSWDWDRGILQLVDAAPTAAPPVDKPVQQSSAPLFPAKPQQALTPQKKTPKPQQPQKQQTPQKQLEVPKQQKPPQQLQKAAECQTAPIEPPAPVKMKRSLSLPRLVERERKLQASKSKGDAAEVLQAAPEVFHQAPPREEVAENKDMDVEPVVEAPLTAMDVEIEPALPRAFAEDEEPPLKRSRADESMQEQEKGGDLGDDEPDVLEEQEEEGPELPEVKLAPQVEAVVDTAVLLKANNGARRAVACPAAVQSLSDGVLLGGKEGGLVLPAAGFGTYKLKKGDAKGPVLEALRAGYRLVDTAQVYENEADVGTALKESGVPREDIVLETKVWRSSHGYDRTDRKSVV